MGGVCGYERCVDMRGVCGLEALRYLRYKSGKQRIPFTERCWTWRSGTGQKWLGELLNCAT